MLNNENFTAEERDRGASGEAVEEEPGLLVGDVGHGDIQGLHAVEHAAGGDLRHASDRAGLRRGHGDLRAVGRGPAVVGLE